KLFYIDADEASLVPTRTAADERGMWSRGDWAGSAKNEERSANGSARIPLAVTPPDAAPRRVYDVRPRPAAWGWQVVAYTWTKSIAAGSFLAIVAGRLMSGVTAAVSA